MNTPPVQASEQEQVKSHHQHSWSALGTVDIDDVARLAAGICHTPPGLVGIIDHNGRQFVSNGIPFPEEANAVFDFTADDVSVVSDLTKNDFFRNNPMVTGAPDLVFYAGIPLVTTQQRSFGTLCVWDTVTRKLDEQQVAALQALANILARHIEQGDKIGALDAKISELKSAYTELDNFATIAAHDLKSPLNAMISLTHLLQNNYAGSLDEEGNEYINFLSDAANNLTGLVTGVLNYSRATQVGTDHREHLNFTDLVEEITGLIQIPDNVSLVYEKSDRQIYTSHVAARHILLNLLDNAIKHNNKSAITIEITLTDGPDNYTLKVTDNGPGIDTDDREQIFDLFKKGRKYKGRSMTTGLAIVKKLAEKMGGEVTVKTEPGQGSTFTVVIPK